MSKSKIDNSELALQVANKIKVNIHNLSEAEAKKFLGELIEALVILFVEAEPKLADPTIQPENKVKPFFMSIAKMAAEFLHAYAIKAWDKEPLERFERKVEKFKNLEHVLTVITK